MTSNKARKGKKKGGPRNNAGRRKNFPGIKEGSKKRIIVPEEYSKGTVELLKIFWTASYEKNNFRIESLIPMARFLVETIPVLLWEPATRLFSELWKTGLLNKKSKIEDIIERLRGENIALFLDSKIPASFGIESFSTEKHEWLNLEDYLSNRKIESKSRLAGLIVTGESMVGAGIFPNDLLIAERLPNSVEPQKDDIVIARTNREITVKRFSSKTEKYISLISERYYKSESRLYEKKNIEILGIVHYVIHSPKNRN